MRIQRIDSNTRVNKNQNVKSTKFVFQPSFNGNYHAVYKAATKQKLRTFHDAVRLYMNLYNAAKTESGLFRGSGYYVLQKAPVDVHIEAKKNPHEGDLLTSTSYPSPLISMSGKVIDFHDPINGTYGQGNISFYCEGDSDLVVSRDRDYHKFYYMGKLKESFELDEMYDMKNHFFYNKDGTRNNFKTFFLGSREDM